MSTETITGGRELDAFLQLLPVRVEQNIYRSAARQAMNVFKGPIKANITVADGGDLARSVRVSTRSKSGTVYGYVKIGNKKAFYGRWIEFGTAAHGIKKGAVRKTGKLQTGVLHPGISPKPYVRPAFDSMAPAAIAAFAAQVRKRLATIEGLNTPAPEGE